MPDENVPTAPCPTGPNGGPVPCPPQNPPPGTPAVVEDSDDDGTPE